MPDTGYARSGDVHIAYQVVGCGPIDVITLRDNHASGVAVHAAARVGALAFAGEVLVSRTVVDLVAGSGITFVARGEHDLKGLPNRVELFAATV